MMTGGISSSHAADKEIQDICDKLKADLESKAGREFTDFVAISYSSQVVAGTNFFIKIHVGDEVYGHARIYRPLPGQGDPTVHSWQDQKTKEDPILHF